MRFPRLSAPLAALTALSIGLASPVLAQEVPSDLPEVKAEDVSVGQIVSFVNAMIAAERVRQEYLVKIDGAETEDEIKALIAEAEQKGIAEVERVRGITPAEYMAISLAARDSEELTARIEQRVAQMKLSQGFDLTNEPANRPEGVVETEAQ